jgi:hypothetical protein
MRHVKSLSAALALVASIGTTPAAALAGGRHWGHHHHHGGDGAAIAAAVIGTAFLGSVIVSALLPPSVPVYASQQAPPERDPYDPYDNGYDQGYEEGVERGRGDRYDEGYRRGYEEGVRAGREAGRTGSGYYY